jgi:hypothetical protein
MKRFVFLVVFLLLAIGGAAAWFFYFRFPTFEQARQEYGPKYAARREQLKKIAELLPAKGSVKGNTPAKSLDPLPVYDEKQESYNVEIAMHEQLLDPDVELGSKKEVDLLLYKANLILNMQILGPRSKTSVSGRLDEKVLRRYEDALKLPYLVVLRPLVYVRPLYFSREKYTPGFVELEGFVVDLRKDAVVASFRASGKSADRTTVAFRPGESEKESVESAAYSTLWEDARKSVAKALAEVTGGTFEFGR